MDTDFRSDDILLIAFLLTQTGITLIDVVEESPRHFVFVLSNPKKCIFHKKDYLNNAVAPARELFAQREMLISEIKNKAKSQRGGDRYGN